jgi:4-amino-4-deoxy-L-arabinose transferase-like glycosyltransferase
VSALFGVLGIAICLLVSWRFFDRRAALAGALLLAVSPMWIGFSRDAHLLHYVLLYALCVLGAVLASLERPSPARIAASCVLCALALHMYQPAYVAIPFVAVAWLVVAVRDSRWRTAAARGLALGLPLACLVAVPPLYYHVAERFAGEGYLPLRHLARNAARPDSAADWPMRLSEGVAAIWRHFASDGAPLHIIAGVENYVLIGGTVHLPWVSSLFLIGFGACMVEARHRRTVRLLLLLTLLGVLPALLSETVLARRLQVFDACFFVIGGIGALAVGSALVALLGARSRRAVSLALAAAALALTATAWSTFRGLVERAEPDFDREFAEAVSAGIVADEIAVMLFPPSDPRRTIQLLAWDRLPRRESARLLFWAQDARELAPLEAVPGRAFVRLAVRERSVWGDSPCSITTLRREVARLGAPASRWTESSFGGPEHASLPAYLSLRIPIGDFALAKELAMTCAEAPPEPR